MRAASPAGLRETGLLIALLLSTGLGSIAVAQTPPLPSAAPIEGERAAAGSPDSVSQRLQKLEETNRKLLERIEQLSQENRKLSEEVKDLSKRVKPPSEGGEGPSEAKKSDQEKKDSGLAGQGGWEKLRTRPVQTLIEEEATESGSGVRLLPNSQGVGNRHLERIPMRTYYDYGRDGLSWATEDDEFLLKLRGELQADAMDYLGAAQDPVHSGFYLPRTRFYFQGHFTKPISYQFSFQRSYTTFGPLNVFLNFNYDRRLQFRVGRFKVPFTYEWYHLNNWRLITPERSLFATNFGLNRQIGLMAWGDVLERRIEYAVGIFDGPRNSLQDYNAAKDVAAFLNIRPFRRQESLLQHLNIGGSVDYGKQDNPLDPAILRTNANASSEVFGSSEPITNATVPFLAFNNNVRERGNRELWELHLAYYYGGISLYSGWGSGFDSYAIKNESPVRLPVTGYNVTVAYLITGETLNERTIVDPIRRFDLRPGKFGLGAFEPFVRYTHLDLGRQVFTAGLADPNLWTNHASLVDVGLNWYLNRSIKIYFDWEHAIFGNPVYFRPGGLRSTNDLLWVRFQFYF